VPQARIPTVGRPWNRFSSLQDMELDSEKGTTEIPKTRKMAIDISNTAKLFRETQNNAKRFKRGVETSKRQVAVLMTNSDDDTPFEAMISDPEVDSVEVSHEKQKLVNSNLQLLMQQKQQKTKQHVQHQKLQAQQKPLQQQQQGDDLEALRSDLMEMQDGGKDGSLNEKDIGGADTVKRDKITSREEIKRKFLRDVKFGKSRSSQNRRDTSERQRGRSTSASRGRRESESGRGKSRSRSRNRVHEDKN